MTKRRMTIQGSAIAVSLAAALALGLASPAPAATPRVPLLRCAADAVVAGTVCLDQYEASVWRVPDPTGTNAILTRKIQLGSAILADLTAGGATQLGLTEDDYAPCRHDGQNCAADIFAVSLPSVKPSANISWFQAQEACANAGKRLPTSAEWQVGANGTPDPGPDNGTTDCNSDSGMVEFDPISLTRARTSCVSARGAFDMVGNLGEWVADWAPAPTFCPGWASFSNDQMCLAGASTTTNSPGALVRGGWFFGAAVAGPLAVVVRPPARAVSFVGFRCVR